MNSDFIAQGAGRFTVQSGSSRLFCWHDTGLLVVSDEDGDCRFSFRTEGIPDGLLGKFVVILDRIERQARKDAYDAGFAACGGAIRDLLSIPSISAHQAMIDRVARLERRVDEAIAADHS
jgi:hypothetical protein